MGVNAWARGGRSGRIAPRAAVTPRARITAHASAVILSGACMGRCRTCIVGPRAHVGFTRILRLTGVCAATGVGRARIRIGARVLRP